MSPVATLYERLLSVLGYIAASGIVLATAGITADVVARNTGLGAISWMLEVVEYALFIATFAGAPWALRLGAHVSVDVVFRVLPDGAQQALRLFANLLGIGISGFLLYYAIYVTLDSASIGALVIKELIFPEWWIFLLVDISFGLILIEFVLRLVSALRGVPRGEGGLGGQEEPAGER